MEAYVWEGGGEHRIEDAALTGREAGNTGERPLRSLHNTAARPCYAVSLKKWRVIGIFGINELEIGC